MTEMKKQKVLIADSTPSVRQFIRHALEDYFSGISIEAAGNGKNIRSRIEGTQFDLVIYEREMPMCSGEEFLGWIKQNDALKSVAVIIISANSEMAVLRKAKELGADDYLLKPLLADPLVRKVREIFNLLSGQKEEKRKFTRYKTQGGVMLSAGNKQIRAELINVSKGGVLCIVERSGKIPDLFERYQIRLECSDMETVDGLDGFVIRMQAAVPEIDSSRIHIAVKFLDSTPPETKKNLLAFIAGLKSVRAGV